MSLALDLNFAGASTLAGAVLVGPTPLLARSTTGTYIDNAGLLQTAAINAPRFDYDPSTLAAKGLLIEEQRVNLITYSGALDNAAWAKVRATVTANAITAPDGTLSADKLVEDSTAANNHQAFFSNTANTTYGAYAGSIYIKQGERRYAQIRLTCSANGTPVLADIVVDTQSGTITATNNVLASGITNAGGGWWRVYLTQTHATGSQVNLSVFISTVSSYQANPTYSGDGASGLYVWGAQLEAGAFPTSYIPTSGSQVTRAADICSITGASFSGFWNATEGTLTGEGTTGTAVSAAAFLVGVAGSNTQNSLSINHAAASSLRGFAAVANVGVANLVSGLLPGASHNFAFAYKQDDYAASGDGGAVLTDTSAAVPATIQMHIGSVIGTQHWNGHIKRLRYWNTRLSNADLVSLSGGGVYAEIPAASVTLTARAPAVAMEIGAPVASLEMTPFAPALAIDAVLPIPASALAMTAYVPTFEEEFLGSLAGIVRIRPALSGKISIN